jgi:hypothetical protein
MDPIKKQFADAGLVASDTSEYELPGGITSKDGDTFLMPDGRTMRLQGVDTAETQKIGKTAASFTPSQLGADTQSQYVRDIIRNKGFSTPTFSGQKDEYGRDIGDLVNDKGQRLSSYLLNNRLATPLMPTNDQMTGMATADLFRSRDRLNNVADTTVDTMWKALNEERNVVAPRLKGYADTAAEYGASLDNHGKSAYYAGAGFIRPEEDYKGDARSNIKTGLSSAALSVEQASYNLVDMLGTTTGSEFLKNYGQDRSAAIKHDISNLPQLRSGEALDSEGNWKLDSFTKMADYAIGTAAASAPQMALSIAAAALAPATFGASLSVPALIYAGQTWENQTEKNVGWALASGITQSAIETLGITGVFTNVFEKATQKEIVAQLVKAGRTPFQAEQALISVIRKDLMDVSAASKLVEGGIAKKVGKAVGIGVLEEAPEEMLQETTQYFGEQSGFKLPDNPEDMIALHNRILNAGVGGAVLGGGLGGTRKLASGMMTQRGAPDNLDAEYRKTLVDGVPTTSSVIDDARVMIEDPNAPPSLVNLKSQEEFKRSSSGLAGGVMNWFKDKGLRSTYDKWSNTIMGADGYRGKFSAALSTMIGANRSINGGSIEEEQTRVARELQNSFGSPDDIRRDFGVSMVKISAALTDPKSLDFIKRLLDIKAGHGESTTASALQYLKGQGTGLGIQEQYADGLAKYADRLDSLITKYNDRTKQNLSVNSFLDLKPVNKNAINSNQGEFANLLSTTLGITTKEANDAVSRILNSPDMNFATDPFDDPLNESQETMMVRDNLAGILNDPKHAGKFAKFLNRDVNENAFGLAAKGAASYVNRNFIGNKGGHLAALVDAAVRTGEISPERGAFMAKELSDWLEMRQGTFHEVKNKYIKGALHTINFLSTVSSLPLAAVSSTVEFAQVFRNLNTPQSLKAARGLLHGFSAEFSGVLAAISGRTSDKADAYHSKLFEAGYQSRGDIGKRNDVVTGYYQKWTEGFFKMTGLTSITNITRYAKLSIGADAIGNWLDVVKKSNPRNPTQDAVDARAHLVRIGVDVEALLAIDALSPAEASRDGIRQRIEQEMSNGVHNFVTEAVIHPTKMNRPKFYSDPYYQLVTQFQGYVSAFSANILPRLLGDLKRTGSKDQTNAAATIAMMMALTFMALTIKDLIKYGESPPEWLKDEKKFQRYIGQSGVLGVGQRVWDTISPQLPTKDQNSILASGWHHATSQAPALEYINKLDVALSADPGKKTKAVVRTLPVFGTSPAFAEYLQQQLGE